jgi:large subunit ribosomal protein L29
MKAKEIRELGAEEIRQRITEEEEQLQQFRFQHAVATLPSPILLRQKRRLIARLETILAQKEQAG